MDNGLSRRRQGFKSPWGRQQEIKAPAVMQVPFCMKENLPLGGRFKKA